MCTYICMYVRRLILHSMHTFMYRSDSESVANTESLKGHVGCFCPKFGKALICLSICSSLFRFAYVPFDRQNFLHFVLFWHCQLHRAITMKRDCDVVSILSILLKIIRKSQEANIYNTLQ